MEVDARVIEGEALDVLRTLESASVDAVICDPPYPCIKRSYGYWTEAEWFAMIDPVVEQCRRVLRPSGSAVFVLQPNSERVGRMRTWLWRFMADWGERWGIVQDAYWWNTCAPPGGGEGNRRDLLRPGLKACVWLGASDCWRDRSSVLWTSSEANVAERSAGRAALERLPSGLSMRRQRCAEASVERGGVTPFNLLPIPNGRGRHGHSAATPLALLRWWTRYICPPGGLILDPFLGSGTTALAALQEGRRCVGIERVPEYVEIARRRIAEHVAKDAAAAPLFAGGTSGVRS